MLLATESPVPERPTREILQLGSTNITLPLLPSVASFLRPGWTLVGWLPECHLSHPRYIEFNFALTERVTHLLRGATKAERVSHFVKLTTQNLKEADPILGLLTEEFTLLTKFFLPEERNVLFFGGASAFETQVRNGIQVLRNEVWADEGVLELYLASIYHLLAIKERQPNSADFSEHLLGCLAQTIESIQLNESASARDILFVRLTETAKSVFPNKSQTEALLTDWNKLIADSQQRELEYLSK